MIRCPKCGNQIDGPFCKWCGAAAPTGSTDDAPVKRNIFAWFRGLDAPRKTWIIGGLILVFLLFIFILFMIPEHTPPTVTENTPPDNPKPAKEVNAEETPSAPNAVPIDNASPKAPPGITDKVLSIDAPTLIAAYQTDEKAASARYGNKKLEVTGVVSGSYKAGPGFFGLADAALITLGEPHPITLDETLQIPGISAYSEDSSLFGQPNTIAIADRLRVGETVTVVCTARDPMPVSEKPVGILVSSQYRVILRDCTLQAPPKAAPEPNENPNPGAIPQAGDQNDPVDAYRPCVEATQHLRVPEQIDLDLPSNFGPPEEPPPNSRFYFPSPESMSTRFGRTCSARRVTIGWRFSYFRMKKSGAKHYDPTSLPALLSGHTPTPAARIGSQSSTSSTSRWISVGPNSQLDGSPGSGLPYFTRRSPATRCRSLPGPDPPA